MPDFGLGSTLGDVIRPLGENLGRGVARGPRGLSSPTAPVGDEEQEEGLRALDLDDLLLFAPRGVEGLIRSVGDLANFVPGLETDFSSRRFLGRSDTVVGGLAEGAAQFLIPFGAAGKVLGGLGRLAGSSGRILAAERAAGLTASGLARSAVQGAAADAVAFSGHEQRLSNLIQSIPALRNPVTEFLAADPDDSEAVGRFKNILEGLALGALTEPLFAVFGALRAGRKAAEAGASPEQITRASQLAMPEGSSEAVDAAVDRLLGVERGDDGAVTKGLGPEFSPFAERFAESLEAARSTQEGFELPIEAHPDLPQVRAEEARRLEVQSERRAKFKKARKKRARKARKRVEEGAAANPRDPKLELDSRVLSAYDAGGMPGVIALIGEKAALSPDQAAAAIAKSETLERELRGAGHTVLADTMRGQPHQVRQAIGAWAEGDMNLAHLDLDEQGLALTRAIENVLEVKIPNRSTEARMVAEAEQVLEALYDMSPDQRMLWRASTVLNAKEATANALALRIEYTRHVSRVKRLLSEEGSSPDELRLAMTELAQHRALTRSVGGEAGRTLRGQGVFVGPSGEEAIVALAEAGFDPRIGSREYTRRMEQVRTLLRHGGDEAAAALGRFAEMDGMDRAVAMTTELFIGNLISGGKTITSSGLFSSMTAIYDPLEQMLGGFTAAMFGSDQGMAHAVRGVDRLVGMWGAIGNATRQAGRAWRERASVVSRNGREIADYAMTSSWGSQAATMERGVLASMVSSIGRFLQFGPRAMVTLDEFVRTTTAHGFVYAESMARSRAEGLDRAGAAVRATEDLDKSFLNGQAVTERVLNAEARRLTEGQGYEEGTVEWIRAVQRHRSELAERMSFSELNPATEAALAKADEVTAIAELPEGTIGRSVQSFVESHPTMRLILPFTKTPINLAKYGVRRTPIDPLLASGEYLLRRMGGQGRSEILENARLTTTRQIAAGGREGAEVAGRVAAASGFTTLAAMAANSGILTGGGPQDPQQRKSLMAAGWLPYSIRTDEGYIQFQRADPLAMVIGMTADAVELARFADPLEVGEIQSVLQAGFLSMSRNLVSKTYMTGLRTFLDAVTNGGSAASSFVEGLTTSLLIPKAVQQFVPITDDPLLHESQGILQAIQARTPFLASNVPPVRDVLGNPIRKATALAPGGEDSPATLWFDLFLPIAYREVKDDTIGAEFRRLREAFSPPPYRRFGLRLTTYENGAGRQAYDRWGELHGKVKIGGRSLAQSLRRAIRSREYQALPERGEPFRRSPRASALSSIIGQYREAAWDEMLGEFPGLRSEVGAMARTRELLRSGSAPQLAEASRRLGALGS